MTLQADDFPEFFRTVHGHAPFAWQAALCDRVCGSGGWPAALDVPTGMGKTAVLDIAVFALALQAELTPADRTAPTRTFLVVDRRVIVDQAHDRAVRIANALADATGGLLGEVARRLRALAGEDRPPLTPARMRGGVTWASRWLDSARLPAIVTGTVDQLGSRLLFRGYGVTTTMRPVDAALCGKDSLLLLDEAHLSQPFLRTVRAVAAYESRAAEPVLAGRPLRVVLLSATLPKPTDGSLDDVFRCDPDVERSPLARARLEAVKSTALLNVRARGELGPVLAALAVDAATSGAARVAVVCNTVALARMVFTLLPPSEEADRALLIGRCREWERERTAATWIRGRLAATAERTDERPLIFVATQTVEVGADIDVDVLITEACPLDALTQRLGRLNRLGRTPSADAVVVHDQALHGPDVETPVYGSATSRTWDWLVEEARLRGETVNAVTVAKAVATLASAPRLDLGARGLAAGLAPGVRAGLASETPPAPVVLSPVLDIWSRTHPAPDPDQAVAPFLHGLEQPRSEIHFCWRAGLTSPESWEEELEDCPPAAHETVTVSYAEARRVLTRSDRGSTQSDVEGAQGEPDDIEDYGESSAVVGYVVSPDRKVVPLSADARLRPGSTVVLDSGEGGHDQWGWTGRLDGEPVRDVADLGATGPLRVRLREQVWPMRDDEALRRVDAQDDDREAVLWDHLDRLATEAADGSPEHEHLAAMIGPSRRTARVRWTRAAGPVITVARRGGVVSDLSDGAENASPGASSRGVATIGLMRHLRDVERRGGDEAAAVGLNAPLVRAVALAGLAHDLGKADPRFQLLLHGANRYRYELAEEPLAKSSGAQSSFHQRQRERKAAGWPKGMRHEAVSAALARTLVREHPSLFDGIDADLVIHLVGTHHGRGRPLLPGVLDPDPRQVRATLPSHGSQPESEAVVQSDEGIVDWDQPGRFDRLNHRYGRWGLALLESLLRLSDMVVSEDYEREKS